MQSIEHRIENVIDTILEDYRMERDIDRMEQFTKPDKDVLIDVLGKLRRIVFPGYFREKNYRIYNVKHNLSILSRQVALVLTDAENPEAAAKELCLQFLSRIPAVREVVQTDLQAAYDGDPAATSMAEVIFSYPGLYAITVYRLAHELYALNIPMIPRIMTEYAHSITGIDIHPGATIGKHFFIRVSVLFFIAV